MTSVGERLNSFPRAGLGVFPTPLEHLPRMSSLVGRDIYIKRDDTLPLGLGGNKIRKLDLILGGALGASVDTVLTTGGIQSNHCRLTAAASARLGLKCVLFLRDDPPSKSLGNVLLDRLFGAEVRYTGRVGYDDVERQMQQAASSLEAAGRTPLVVPLGGATALGTAAYVDAVRELAEQAAAANLRPKTVVVAAGSGSTLAGLWVGVRSFIPSASVLGVSVSWTVERLTEIATELGIETADLVGCPRPDPERLRISGDYVGSGYTIPTAGGWGALHSLASTEGILLDLTYTAKAFDAVLGEASSNTIEAPIVFWHTGGVPELFARPDNEVLGTAS